MTTHAQAFSILVELQKAQPGMKEKIQQVMDLITDYSIIAEQAVEIAEKAAGELAQRKGQDTDNLKFNAGIYRGKLSKIQLSPVSHGGDI